MAQADTKQSIKAAIEKFQKGNLTDNSLSLFKTLGYNTERQQPFEMKSYAYFKESFLDNDTRFNKEKALVSQWDYIDLLFQLSKNEISNQLALFDTKQVDQTIIEAYLFFAIKLREESYSRTALSQITREINKVFPMPVMVLFKHGKTLTLSVINRRLHKRDEQKDVLEKVTLIKDISTEMPHRAHVEILFDLSFDELLRIHKFNNFVELHNTWQKTLDIKELNKRFYKELSNWYFWAMRNVYFPGASPDADKKAIFQKDEKVREHNAKNLIRLLTRILFIWFTKEKSLIPDELFDESFIKDNLLKSFEPHRKNVPGPQSKESKYYRAILQNLFFATLNQTVGKREFRKSGQHMNVTNLMRYESYFKNKKTFLELVEQTVPFMNGGLFECLDKPSPDLKGKKGGDVIIYEDGFSDRPDNELCVPDYIFFGTSEHADLSEELGNKSKDVEVKGLLNIFKSYKFTITENTPIEEDIALDPELLGKVFENLLASYNPETRTTARRQTGSYYTPPEIVIYMVDESLIAYLKKKLDDAGIKDKEIDLRDLISYSENINKFSAKETAVMIEAIDTCKILDPACGSGAFPMGILHKLVHILHKLDPNNELWKEKQIQKASVIDDAVIRDKLIEDIETAFNNNELDYGRKLYLIENCIYGVDIQPIATQISKLRCFISLIVDQSVDNTKDNFGVRALPNLETKFVAANTLIGLEKPKDQLVLSNPELNKLEKQIKDVRHRLFSAKTPVTKRKLREDDKTLREKLGEKLVDSGLGSETAYQLASWDPYDQNASSSFFDSDWMFGMTHGFDVVLGNPPYLGERGNKELFRKVKVTGFGRKYYKRKMDYFYFFFHKALSVAKKRAIVSFITTNYYITADGAISLRSDFYNRAIIRNLINFNELRLFDSAIGQHNMITILEKGTNPEFSSKNCIVKIIGNSKDETLKNILSWRDEKSDYFAVKQKNLYDGENKYIRLSNVVSAETKNDLNSILYKIRKDSVPLVDLKNINQGVLSGVDKVTTKHCNLFNIPEDQKGNGVFVLSNNEIKELNLNDNERTIIKPYYKNSNIFRYFTSSNEDSKNLIYATRNLNLNDYPHIKKHFFRYEKIIKARSEDRGEMQAAMKVGKWWVIFAARAGVDFESSKIVCPQRSHMNTFGYNEDVWYGGTDIYIITNANYNSIELKYILALLNSKLFYVWLYYKGKRKGELLELLYKPLSEIPIKKISKPEQIPFIKVIDHILAITKDMDYLNNSSKKAKVKELEKQIDHLVYKLYDLTQEEIKIVESSANTKM